jgi:hypothetical protein
LDGIWKNLEGSMKLVSDTGRIKLSYFAKEVNIVTANKGDLTILLDGSKIPQNYAGADVGLNGKTYTSEPKLYNIVKSDNAASHTLEIIVDSPGFEIYTFTFG